MNTALPSYEKVFFVHYQCEDFNKGDDKITSLHICSKDRVNGYSEDEKTDIENYKDKIESLLNQDYTLVHWNQNVPHYGPAHIRSRYQKLTGKCLDLNYGKSINLADWLVKNFGDDYIAHRRLDNLAKLNDFSGSSEESGNRIYPTNRVRLLTKIYLGVIKGTLKTKTNKPKEEPNTNITPPECNSKKKNFRNILWENTKVKPGFMGISVDIKGIINGVCKKINK